MERRECLLKMKGPGDMRGRDIYGVFQILITNVCDLGTCSNCTQMIAWQKDKWFLPLDLFERAIKSLVGYPGIIGIMGGNPCVHPEFRELSEIFESYFPWKARRGLWTNNLNGHGAICDKHYGYFNLNCHGNERWAQEMEDSLPGQTVWGKKDCASVHGAVMVDMTDIIQDENERYQSISNCDVNQRWSPAITLYDGQLKGYFCEVGAAWDQVLRLDLGVSVTQGWWMWKMEFFSRQLRFCHHCGVPLRLEGDFDHANVDTVSKSTHKIAPLGRKVRLLRNIDVVRSSELTDYQGLRHTPAKTEGAT